MKHTTSKPFARGIALALSAIFVMIAFAACGPQANTGDTPAESPASDSSAAPSQNAVAGEGSSMAQGEVVGGVTAAADSEFVTLDNVKVGTATLFANLTPFRNTSNQRAILIRYLYDRLACLNSSGEYIPQGAKSWSVADDGVTWTVELYDYITDSMGNKITVDDIIWFIETSQEKATKPCFSKIASMNKIDDYKMEIVMVDDLADAFQVILESTFLLSEESFASSPDEFASDVISTSPYKITEFQPDSHITLTLRDDYWQKEELIDESLGTNVKELTMVVISEAAQQQIAVETGTIDVMPGMDATVASAFENNPDFLLTMTPANNGNNLMFSGDENRLIANDLNLRKAICYAIDVDALIAGAANGYGEQGWDFIPRTSGGFQESWMGEEYYPLDLVKAKEFLDQSNYNGEELVLMGQSTMSRPFTIIQASCQAIGINLKLELQDAALWGTNMFDGRQWDMCVISSGNGGANMWTQFLDGDAYEYGDGMARRDDVLNEMIHFTWKNANYTPENITKVHRYVTDNAYIYGMYLPYTLSVASAKLNIAQTNFNNQGQLDIAACKFTAA